MLVLGFILLVIAAIVAIVLIVGGANDPAAFAAAGISVTNLNVAEVFLIGAAAMLVFLIGLSLIRGGFAREHRRRKEHRQLKKLSAKVEQQEAEKERLAAERDSAAARAEGHTDERVEEGTVGTDHGTHGVHGAHAAEPATTEQDRPAT